MGSFSKIELPHLHAYMHRFPNNAIANVWKKTPTIKFMCSFPDLLLFSYTPEYSKIWIIKKKKEEKMKKKKGNTIYYNVIHFKV